MFAIRPVAGASALALLFAGSAQAALTAGQVWQSWKDGAAESGMKLAAATEAESGGVLTLNGVTFAPEGADTPLTISDITLTEQADGSVLVTPGASVGFEQREEDRHASVKLAHEGLSLVVRESGAGGMTYDVEAGNLNLTVDAAKPSGAESGAPEAVIGSVVIDGLRGSWSDSGAGAGPDARDLALKLAAAGLSYDFAITDPGEGGNSVMSASTEAPDLDFAMHLPAGYSFDPEDAANSMPRMLEDGFSINATLTQGNSKSKATAGSEEIGLFDIASESEPGSSAFRLDRDAFLISADYGGMTVSATSDALPIPVNVTAESLGFRLQSPVLAADEAGDFAAVLRLVRLAVNDEVWSMLDPGSVLRHDPLNLVIDLAGKTKIDWLAIATAEEIGEEPPVPEPQSLDINEVTLKLAGAALLANGAFTFDNSMGFPMPLGMAKVTVTGATQLVDGLVALGLLSREDADGAMMMAGMFMKPGDEPDSLTSTIEAKKDGSITVNGMEVPF